MKVNDKEFASTNSQSWEGDEKAKRWHHKMNPSGWKLSNMLIREEQRAIINSFKKNEVAGPKRKQCSVVDVSGGESKV